ncbi:hypothetical protein RND81_10G170300 [Saponaria officinalis]|uniref:Uncharacterized protein n=1 Tax=Saponaria officinalis TaxID=3572 RepID=A0AAW1I319_SAPOF
MGAINPINPPIFTNSYHTMLQESTQHFLIQLKSGVSDFSHFNLMFSRLIQTISSPPIEIIWFYTAVNYHTHKNTIKAQNQSFGEISCLDELFHSLVSCSGSCSSSVTRIAVLAPLVSELHNLILELKSLNEFRFDNVVGREIRCLVDRLVSYISLCCCEGVNDHDESPAFSPCFVDLVKVWTVGRRGTSCAFEDDFRIFFPLLNDESRNEVWLRGEVGVLAGFVMCQVFLLNLCLKFNVEEKPQNLEEEISISAVDAITGFRSCYFFDALLKMLLESNLPVTSLLTASDGVVLQKALFGAIVLVDYPFFNPACGIGLCHDHLNTHASTWLFVADRAMQFVRNNDCQTKLISYMKAFTKSLIHSQLLKWVSAQIGIIEDKDKPRFSTPSVFLEWLAQIRSTGSRTFDDEFSLFLDKVTHYKSEMTPSLPYSEACQKVGSGDGISEDLEMIDSTDAIKSTCKYDFSVSEACRKRKGENDENSVRVKLLKRQTERSPINNFSSFRAEVVWAGRR